MRLSGILGVIAILHVAGIALYLAHRGDVAAAGALAGSGVLAYVLGVRHAFDADHIAAIDDTTRVMLMRGRRPVGVGFFFAMSHLTVLVALALLVATAASRITQTQVDSMRSARGTVAVVVAMVFLLLVATLNAAVLRRLIDLWRRLRSGADTSQGVEEALLMRGFINRIAGGRFGSMIKHSWHMYAVGLIMGLGLATASEITLLALSASSAAGGALSVLAVLSLPLLFAAGMSTFETADSLIMTRLHSWSYRDPARTLFFTIATTAMTVFIAFFIVSVYIAGVLGEDVGATFRSGYASVSANLEFFGYGIAAVLAVTWVAALMFWKRRGQMAVIA